jgi:surface protein
MKITKKKVFATGGLCLILAGAIVATVAYSHDRSVFNNKFQLDKYQTEFSETFDAPTNWKTCDTTDKEFVVKNTYDEAISVRLKTSSTWKDGSGRTMSNYSSGSRVNMALINYANTNEWLTKKYDGVTYLEYYRDLQPGETTSSFISGVTFNCDANLDVDTRYNDATYTLTITAQTIQASAKSDNWRTSATLYRPVNNNFNYYVWPSDDDDCSLRGNSGYVAYSCVKHIVHADVLPGGVTTRQIGSGDYPIYGWLSSDYRTLYWYSEADDIYFPSDSSDMFSNMGKLESADGLEDIIASRATNMRYMFYYDHVLTDIDALSSWDVSNVERLDYMFFYTYLDTLEPLRNWDVSKVWNMNKLFTQDKYNAKIGTAEPISGWNVSNVTSAEGMFYYIRDFDASSLDSWTLNSELDIQSINFDCNTTPPSWYTYSISTCRD